MATAQNGNQFDFKAYNAIISGAGSGLKLHLAIQMLRDVDYVMYKFDNPLQADLGGCVNELKEIQVKAKKQAADRKKDHAE
jgi:hypothetical protein